MARIQHFIGQHTTTLRKTASYYLVHIAVAALVAYAVTGNLYAALTLSLLEPTVQAFAFFFHEKAWQRSPRRRSHTLAKTGSYYLLHMSVATAVAYTVTGNWVQAFTLSLLEPAVQMVFFYAHEKLWERRLQQQTALAA
ncbi:MAG: DUF2061 domain-containing protein [Acidovorax sp.]|jgi:uncharacterized membrane protein|nr:DUF2061 domain-containing protein [Acidovorax sp.]